MFVSAIAVCLTLVTSAGAQEFRVETAPSYLTSESTATFANASNATKIECGEAAYWGTMAATAAKQIQISAQFSKCWTNFGQQVSIHMNGCYFLWGAPAEAGKTGTVQIGCPATQKVEFTAGSCTAKANPQALGNGATYANYGEKSARDFVSSISATGIDYELSPSTCTLTFGSGSDGTLISSPTVRGFNAGFLGAWVS
ncbi:MAG TPA: hypothetical protein VJU14_04575 [Solirubrobacterales bacterium]|nr:hypothetical protein [Solirubrobacterales bacterium]